MTFPAVAATATTAISTATTSHTINLPTGIVSGNLLLGFFSNASFEQFATWPSDPLFTEIRELTRIGNTLSVAYRTADGSEGSTITVTTPGTVKSAATFYRITGWLDTQAPEVSTGVTGTSANPDPDSLTPTGGAEDYLWIAALGFNHSGGSTSVTTWPTNYTVSQMSPSSGGGDSTHCSAATAGRELNGASEDPGTFTLPFSESFCVCTVVVYPSGALPESFPARRSFVG